MLGTCCSSSLLGNGLVGIGTADSGTQFFANTLVEKVKADAEESPIHSRISSRQQTGPLQIVCILSVKQKGVLRL